MNMLCSISHLMLNTIYVHGRAEDRDRYLQFARRSAPDGAVSVVGASAGALAGRVCCSLHRRPGAAGVLKAGSRCRRRLCGDALSNPSGG